MTFRISRISSLLVVALGLCLTQGCSKLIEPKEFDIVGQWGVVTETFYFPNMDPSYCGPLTNGYYEYWTFLINGALSVKHNQSQKIEYGDYIYNANKKTLRYIYDGYNHYIDADVFVSSPTEMIVTANFSYGGKTIYQMKKTAW